ncbi:MAG: hypothetical protein JRJ82_16365 [Deltaproteobacteria bacterium]|nr:hypothetical protein [Deltaproteobacteria bacterium]
MEGIAEGKEYSSIGNGDLQTILLNVHNDLDKCYIIVNSETQSSFKEELQEIILFNERILRKDEFGFRFAFQRLVKDFMVGYSLSKFLLKNDRRKLKKCPYCDKFFIAKDIKRKRCYSDDCRKTYEREKKRKQREEDPVTYS